MKPSVQELKHALQLLALPVTAQMRLDVGERDRVWVMAHAFQYWYRAMCCESAESLTSQQAAVLAALDRLLTQVSFSKRSSIWSDVDLRRSAGWRQVRKTAREALVAFDWSLELPPPDADIYETLRGEIIHGQWTSTWQTCMVFIDGRRSATHRRVCLISLDTISGEACP
jgi:hypothetical protein